MIGADEITVSDRNWNTAFVGGSQVSVNKYLSDVTALGFTVVGQQVMATKRELEVAFFTPAGRALREKGCDHNWQPIPREGPQMQCSACGRREY